MIRYTEVSAEQFDAIVAQQVARREKSEATA
jgi:hypothetical protein